MLYFLLEIITITDITVINTIGGFIVIINFHQTTFRWIRNLIKAVVRCIITNTNILTNTSIYINKYV